MASRATREAALSGRMTRRILELAASSGLAPAELARRAEVDLALVMDRDARVPCPTADRLMEEASRSLGADGLSVRLLGVVDAETYDAAGLLLLTSRTLHEGLTRAFSHQRLWGDGDRFGVDLDAERLTVRFTHQGPSDLAEAICAELALLETLGAAKALVSSDVVALRVTFRAHAPTTTPSLLTVMFGVEPTYGALENLLELPRAIADAPLRPPLDWLQHVVALQAERALGALPARATLSERVTALTGTGLEWVPLTVEAAASRLGMSTRTLQRRLGDEQTSFERVVDEARRARVDRLLRGGASLKEAAFLVGFADASALTRARARWRKCPAS